MPPKPPPHILRTPPKPRSTPTFARPAPRALPKASQTSSAPPPSGTPIPPPKWYHTSLRDLRFWGGIGFSSLCVCIFIRDHLVTLDRVNGSSMAPTLSPYAHETGERDRIVIQRNLRFGGGQPGSAVRRGDVVTLWKPHKPEEISIKRVVAVEGDTVWPHRGYAVDASVARQSRVATWDGVGVRDAEAAGGDEIEVGRVVVPKGHVWVEGDNWRRSFDSCDFGPVSLGLVNGKAVRVWREWWRLREVGDERKRVKGHWSRVVEAEKKVPVYFDADV